MTLISSLSLRRTSKWENPTLLDQILDSPLQAFVLHVYQLLTWLRGIPVQPPRGKPPITVICISDTHDSIVPDVPDGDLLIHAGDTTNNGSAASIQRQIDWLASLPHRHKVLVAGNHDSYFDIKSRQVADTIGNQKIDLKGIHYLEHESLTLTFNSGRRLNLYGAPGLPKCGGPENAFQYLPQEDPWKNTIPMDTDILITHTPPLYHMDLRLGCPSLLKEIQRTKPTVHVFGHVHCGRGMRAAYWDDFQLAYEEFMAREKCGLLFDMLPTSAWIGVIRFLLLSVKTMAWQWIMLGGVRPSGSVMINAGMQAGNTGRLVKSHPFSIAV